jgi:hypothetical protein
MVGVKAPDSDTVIGVAGGLAFVGGLELVRRLTGQSERAISELGWAVIFGVTAALLAVYGPPLVALGAAAMAVFEVLLTWRAWRRRPRDLLTQNRDDLGAVPGDDPDDRLGARGWAFVIIVGGIGIVLVEVGVSYFVSGLAMLAVAIVVGRFLLIPRPPPPDPPPGHFGPPPDDAFWIEPTGHSYQFTITGRRARVLSWVVSRFFRPPDPPPPR